MKEVPGVSHRGMAVTDMQGLRAGDNALSPAVAAADHQVMALEIELLHG